MEALEDVDLVQFLDFSHNLKFVTLIEEELASLVLAREESGNSESKDDAVIRMVFPPLKPRYSKLLQVTAGRFGLKASVRGWGDERRVVLDATPASVLPAVEAEHFRQGPCKVPAWKTFRDRIQPAKPCEPLAARATTTTTTTKAVVVEEVEKEKPLEKQAEPKEGEAGEEVVEGAEKRKKRVRRKVRRKKEPQPAASKSSASPQPRQVIELTSDEEDENKQEDEEEVVTMSSNKADISSAKRSLAGWDDDSDDDWIAKRRKSSSTSGRQVRGRGGKSQAEQAQLFAVAAAAAKSANGPTDLDDDDDQIPQYQLQKDYSRYMIDPEDTWRPHRKPWVEVASHFEFSNAWSFDPDEQERFEHVGEAKEVRGVAVFKVEHERGGSFSVVITQGGHSGEVRKWLDGKKGRCEEPIIAEYRLVRATKSWEFRVSRLSAREQLRWRTVPWSNANRTSFWIATMPHAEEEQQSLMFGLDEFPERCFDRCKGQWTPSAIAFGPSLNSGKQEAFYLRDISVHGRGTVQGPPFMGREHFVEVLGHSEEEVGELVTKKNVRGKVQRFLVLAAARGDDSNEEHVVLLHCKTSEEAARVAAALGACARQVLSATPFGWVSHDKALQQVEERLKRAQECWRKLSTRTTQQLALFEEHTRRRTEHLEGVRLSSLGASRAIRGSLLPSKSRQAGSQ